MLRRNVALRCAAIPNGVSFGIGGVESKNAEAANCVPSNERGLKASAMFQEGLQTANYDALFGAWSWTYMQPVAKVNIEKMPAPEAKYYQQHTKKPWDISCSDYVEIITRKRFFLCGLWGSLVLAMFFVMPKEKQFSGKKGADGWWIGLPKNQPELFA
jgi:hypothetical protein